MHAVDPVAFLFASVALPLIGFSIGREWERVFVKRKDACPFGGQCLSCQPANGKAAVTVHYKIWTVG